MEAALAEVFGKYNTIRSGLESGFSWDLVKEPTTDPIQAQKEAGQLIRKYLQRQYSTYTGEAPAPTTSALFDELFNATSFSKLVVTALDAALFFQYQGLDLPIIWAQLCEYAREANRPVVLDSTILTMVTVCRGTDIQKICKRMRGDAREWLQGAAQAYRIINKPPAGGYAPTSITMARISALRPDAQMLMAMIVNKDIVDDPACRALPAYIRCQGFPACLPASAKNYEDAKRAYLWYAHKFDLLVKPRGQRPSSAQQLLTYFNASHGSQYVSQVRRDEIFDYFKYWSDDKIIADPVAVKAAADKWTEWEAASRVDE